MLESLHGTFAGGVIAFTVLLPPFVLCFITPIISSYLLLSAGWYMAEVGQALIALVCNSFPKAGQLGTAAAVVITAAIAASDPMAHGAITGSIIWVLMTLANWGHYFAYSPAFSYSMCNLSMGTYFRRCELRGELDQMSTKETLYLFHPHGVVTCGFSCNGVWSQDFISRTTPTDTFDPKTHEAADGRFRGTVFFIARALRETTAIFKAICDLSGRLESSTKKDMLRVMRTGRNMAIIPGGFEDATIYAYGAHRTAMRSRKGLIKYALQYGYTLTPIYTFGENRTYSTFSGLLALRLWINSFQLPAIAFCGKWFAPIYPHNDVDILSYVGPPLKLPTIENPTPADVDAWHAKYLAALQMLFDKNKQDAGEPEARLEIW